MKGGTINDCAQFGNVAGPAMGQQQPIPIGRDLLVATLYRQPVPRKSGHIFRALAQGGYLDPTRPKALRQRRGKTCAPRLADQNNTCDRFWRGGVARGADMYHHVLFQPISQSTLHTAGQHLGVLNNHCCPGFGQHSLPARRFAEQLGLWVGGGVRRTERQQGATAFG